MQVESAVRSAAKPAEARQHVELLPDVLQLFQSDAALPGNHAQRVAERTEKLQQRDERYQEALAEARTAQRPQDQLRADEQRMAPGSRAARRTQLQEQVQQRTQQRSQQFSRELSDATARGRAPAPTGKPAGADRSSTPAADEKSNADTKTPGRDARAASASKEPRGDAPARSTPQPNPGKEEAATQRATAMSVRAAATGAALVAPQARATAPRGADPQRYERIERVSHGRGGEGCCARRRVHAGRWPVPRALRRAGRSAP
jgi:hypothetical protein